MKTNGKYVLFTIISGIFIFLIGIFSIPQMVYHFFNAGFKSAWKHRDAILVLINRGKK